MPTRVSWDAHTQNEKGKVEEKFRAMQLIFERIRQSPRNGLVGADHLETRAWIGAFYDAFHAFTESAYWYLNALYRCGSKPGLDMRKSVKSRCGSQPGFKLVETFCSKWQDEEERRHLLHHNSRTSFIFVPGNPTQAYFHADVRYQKKRIEDRSRDIANQGFYDEPDTSLAMTTLEIVPYVEQILQDARGLLQSLPRSP